MHTCCSLRRVSSFLLVFATMWFCINVPDAYIQIGGFFHIHSNTDNNSGQTKGVLILKTVCYHNFAIRDSMHRSNMKLLCIPCNHIIYQGDFTNKVLCVVYILPSRSATRGASQHMDPIVHQHLQKGLVHL